MKRFQFLVTIILLAPSVVIAGFASNSLVEIDWDAQMAKGVLSAARFSENPDEYIGCSANYWEVSDGEIYSWASCAAGLGAEERITCRTENPKLVDKIAQLNHWFGPVSPDHPIKRDTALEGELWPHTMISCQAPQALSKVAMEPSNTRHKSVRFRVMVPSLIAGILAQTAQAGECPTNMLAIEDFCIDTFEAPNQAGALPLVMYTYHEATAWCAQRAKRLCFDDEWT
jgi:hypothetical protein